MWYSIQKTFINVVQIIKEVLDHTSNKPVDRKQGWAITIARSPGLPNLEVGLAEILTVVARRASK